MGKHESPAFRMIIENGRLVPATQFDAERLDTYRNKTKVRVRFTEEKDRVMVRKWWAVLGLVVKQCDVPWRTKDEASEAIKLALGIVNLTKTVGGQFMQYPKSLTELTDPELDEAVEQMMALIQRMTGIDPETLRKEAADVGEEEDHESSEAAPLPSDAGSDGALPPAQPVAADPITDPSQGGPAEAGDNEAASVASPASLPPVEAAEAEALLQEAANPAPVAALKAEMVTQLMRFAEDRTIWSSMDEHLAELGQLKADWIGYMPGHPTLVGSVFRAVEKYIRDPKIGPKRVREYLEGLKL